MATKTWVGTDSGNEGDWSVAANWSPSGVPTDADDVVLELSTQAVTDGLDQSAIALDSLTIKQSYTGTIAADGTYLEIMSARVDVGEHYGAGTPNGSGRVKLDLRGDGGTASVVVIHNTAGTTEDENESPVRLLFNEATSDLYVRKGSVGIATDAPGEVSILDEIHVGYTTGRSSDAIVVIGSGVTLDELQITGGQTTLKCAATTVGISDGQLQTEGAGAITTMTVDGGVVIANSLGTISTLNCNAGETDFFRSSEDRIVTTPKLKAGATLRYDPAYVTMTNEPAPQEPVNIVCTTP